MVYEIFDFFIKEIPIFVVFGDSIFLQLRSRGVEKGVESAPLGVTRGWLMTA